VPVVRKIILLTGYKEIPLSVILFLAPTLIACMTAALKKPDNKTFEQSKSRDNIRENDSDSEIESNYWGREDMKQRRALISRAADNELVPFAIYRCVNRDDPTEYNISTWEGFERASSLKLHADGCRIKFLVHLSMLGELCIIFLLISGQVLPPGRMMPPGRNPTGPR
jgi:hypothetical protein